MRLKESRGRGNQGDWAKVDKNWRVSKYAPAGKKEEQDEHDKWNAEVESKNRARRRRAPPI